MTKTKRMDNSRENILQRIRQANRGVSREESEDIVNKKISHHIRGPIPESQENKTAHFIKKAEQAAASLAHVSTDQDIVDSVLAYLSEHQLQEKILSTATALLGDLQWPNTMQVETRNATADDMVVLVEAKWAIAETGSIVMCSSKETPVSLNFLPDHYICVVRENGIVSTMEDVWDLLRKQTTIFPRAVNIITGPSRTADVEQIIQMGAHGPRCVHILLKE